MQDSFEANHVTNPSLAETLKKFLVTQDIFATTNYDLLLEQATGLSALSYEQADQTFLMLDEGKSDAVLHIHGIYDSAGGIDNIIADEEQYAAIMDDKGAQFIQQILGTMTLVLWDAGRRQRTLMLLSLSGSRTRYCILQIASQNGHLCHIRRPLCDLIGGQPGTH